VSASACVSACVSVMSQTEILEEEYNPDYEPTQSEIVEYAVFLGIDLEKEKDLLWIAREGLKAPLPEAWRPCKADDGSIYYFNFSTGESVWDHPCDRYYKSLFEEERKKKEKQAATATNSNQNNGNGSGNGGSNGGSSNEATATRSSVPAPGSPGPTTTSSSSTLTLDKLKKPLSLKPVHSIESTISSTISNVLSQSQSKPKSLAPVSTTPSASSSVTSLSTPAPVSVAIAGASAGAAAATTTTTGATTTTTSNITPVSNSSSGTKTTTPLLASTAAAVSASSNVAEDDDSSLSMDMDQMMADFEDDDDEEFDADAFLNGSSGFGGGDSSAETATTSASDSKSTEAKQAPSSKRVSFAPKLEETTHLPAIGTNSASDEQESSSTSSSVTCSPMTSADSSLNGVTPLSLQASSGAVSQSSSMATTSTAALQAATQLQQAQLDILRQKQSLQEERFQMELSEAEARHKLEMDRLKRKHDDEVRHCTNDHERRMRDLRSKQDADVGTASSAVDASEVRKQLTDQINRLKNQHEETLALVQNDVQRWKSRAEQITTENDALQQRLTQKQGSLESSNNPLIERLRSDKLQLQTELDHERSENERTNNSVHEMRNKLSAERASWRSSEKKMLEAKLSVEAKLVQAQSQLNQSKHRLELQEQETREKLSSWKSKLSDYESSVGDLKAQYQRQQQQLERTESELQRYKERSKQRGSFSGRSTPLVNSPRAAVFGSESSARLQTLNLGGLSLGSSLGASGASMMAPSLESSFVKMRSASHGRTASPTQLVWSSDEDDADSSSVSIGDSTTSQENSRTRSNKRRSRKHRKHSRKHSQKHGRGSDEHIDEFEVQQKELMVTVELFSLHEQQIEQEAAEVHRLEVYLHRQRSEWQQQYVATQQTMDANQKVDSIDFVEQQEWLAQAKLQLDEQTLEFNERVIQLRKKQKWLKKARRKYKQVQKQKKRSKYSQRSKNSPARSNSGGNDAAANAAQHNSSIEALLAHPAFAATLAATAASVNPTSVPPTMMPSPATHYYAPSPYASPFKRTNMQHYTSSPYENVHALTDHVDWLRSLGDSMKKPSPTCTAWSETSHSNQSGSSSVAQGNDDSTPSPVATVTLDE
jgi:WW domain